jgi:hypothetical protein
MLRQQRRVHRVLFALWTRGDLEDWGGAVPDALSFGFTALYVGLTNGTQISGLRPP